MREHTIMWTCHIGENVFLGDIINLYYDNCVIKNHIYCEITLIYVNILLTTFCGVVP